MQLLIVQPNPIAPPLAYMRIVTAAFAEAVVASTTLPMPRRASPSTLTSRPRALDMPRPYRISMHR